MLRLGAKRLSCSFCGRSKEAVKKFISGPSVYICDECVAHCSEILRGPEQAGLGVELWDRRLECSFCAKPKTRVGCLVSGPGVYVCNECVVLCNEILAEAGDATV